MMIPMAMLGVLFDSCSWTSASPSAVQLLHDTHTHTHTQLVDIMVLSMDHRSRSRSEKILCMDGCCLVSVINNWACDFQ